MVQKAVTPRFLYAAFHLTYSPLSLLLTQIQQWTLFYASLLKRTFDIYSFIFRALYRPQEKYVTIQDKGKLRRIYRKKEVNICHF